MIPFDANDPFPCVVGTYAEAQEHSAKVDAWLGLEAESIEAGLRARAKPEGQQLWIGLPVQAMLTPYTEIRQILEELGPGPGEKIVDLGAGYGRMGFVVGRHFPGVRFLGYEYVPERVEAGRRALERLGYPGIELRTQDLTSPTLELAPAEYYFLYDYGAREAIEGTLQALRKIAASRAITVVARGRASRDAIERAHPWLSQVVAPQHRPHYSVYRSRA